MFKRRKPDEPDHMPRPDAPAALAPPADAPSLFAPAAPDNGLGVPPRPMPPPAASTPASLNKDPAMARPPFPAAPSPQGTMTGNPIGGAPGGSTPGNPPMPSSAPPRPPGPPSVTRPAAAPERRTLVVGRGISVQGMVQDAERLVVEGTVEATMIHATELAVSPGGIFKGEVEVEDAEVAGTIDGTILARGALIVRATGIVLGTARCRRLQVEDGGQITGRIEMITEPAPRAAAATVAAGVEA
jgi:cytoskeletal protein CcmA (bactofilin family)